MLGSGGNSNKQTWRYRLLHWRPQPIKIDVFVNEFGMIQIVKQSTHADYILDKFFTNRPDLFDNCRVVTSLIPIKHKAILINCDSEPTVKAKMEKRVIKFFDVLQLHTNNR